MWHGFPGFGFRFVWCDILERVSSMTASLSRKRSLRMLTFGVMQYRLMNASLRDHCALVVAWRLSLMHRSCHTQLVTLLFSDRL